MTVLVTGAAGFIGSHTCDLLLAGGHEVHGADNFRTGRRENLAAALVTPGFHLHNVDLVASGQMAALIEKISPSVIIHLAALVSVQESIANPALNQLLNVDLTHAVVDAALCHGVSRVVYASSAAVYGEPAQLPLPETAALRPQSPYGRAKMESESILLEAAHNGAITVACLRYFNVYGPRQDAASPYSGVISLFARKLARGEPIFIHGDGRQTRDFIHVSDVARANVLAATRVVLFSGSFNICTGRSTAILDLVGLLGRHHPVPEVRHSAAKPGDIVHSCGDPAAASRHLGFEARVGLAAGLQDLA